MNKLEKHIAEQMKSSEVARIARSAGMQIDTAIDRSVTYDRRWRMPRFVDDGAVKYVPLTRYGRAFQYVQGGTPKDNPLLKLIAGWM